MLSKKVLTTILCGLICGGVSAFTFTGCGSDDGNEETSGGNNENNDQQESTSDHCCPATFQNSAS